MTIPQLYLITPPVADPEALAPRLAQTCAAGPVAAVLARFEPADERTLIKRVKALAPVAQEHGSAFIAHIPSAEGLDPVVVATRGGADGLHVTGASADLLRDLRERLQGERILGVGGLRGKHEAMEAGETEVDYLLFGEPRQDGSVPPLEAVLDRAGWWAEIFETPCVAYSASLEDLPALARTGAEFVALGEAVFTHPEGPAAAVNQALAALAESRKS